MEVCLDLPGALFELRLEISAASTQLLLHSLSFLLRSRTRERRRGSELSMLQFEHMDPPAAFCRRD